MLASSKPGKYLALTGAICAILSSGPAFAECLVEGRVYLSYEDGIGDTTGPALYIKASPEDSHYIFVRLRDGRFITEHLAGSTGLPVRVLTDAHNCPTEGLLRDAGTAVRMPELLRPGQS